MIFFEWHMWAICLVFEHISLFGKVSDCKINMKNFVKQECILLNEIAATTTNNFIAVNILLKNRTFSAHFRYGPLQE